MKRQNRTPIEKNVFFKLNTHTSTPEKIYVSDYTKPFTLPQRLPPKENTQAITLIGANRIPELLESFDENHMDIF
jgi:hypothetical protein